jgi:hypothetical protein
MNYQNQSIAMAQDYKRTNKDNEIKQAIALDSFGATERSEQNPYLLEKLSQMKEKMMKSMLRKTASKSIPEST